MTAAGEAIAAMSAGDMTFAGYEIAGCESFDAIANAINDADEFVPDGNGNRNRFLRPSVPVIYMYVGSADGCFNDADKHFVAADFGNGDFFEPESRLGPALHDGFHRFLHAIRLGAWIARANGG